MTWQVTDRANDRFKDYYNPDICSIHMKDCVFGNHPATAQRIFDGKHKTVCAWVDCSEIHVSYVKAPDYEKPDVKNLMQFRYNPKKSIHWNTDIDDNADGLMVEHLVTHNRKIYG